MPPNAGQFFTQRSQKSRGFRLVPRQRTQARHANDIDEYRALQRTGGRVAAVNPILITPSLPLQHQVAEISLRQEQMSSRHPAPIVAIPADPPRPWTAPLTVLPCVKKRPLPTRCQ